MLKSTKIGLAILSFLGFTAAIAVVGENDYQDEVIALHAKCEMYHQLVECRDYDDTAYLKLMSEKK